MFFFNRWTTNKLFGLWKIYHINKRKKKIYLENLDSSITFWVKLKLLIGWLIVSKLSWLISDIWCICFQFCPLNCHSSYRVDNVSVTERADSFGHMLFKWFKTMAKNKQKMKFYVKHQATIGKWKSMDITGHHWI